MNVIRATVHRMKVPAPVAAGLRNLSLNRDPLGNG